MLHCTERKSCLLVVKHSTLLTSDKCQENHCSGPTYSHQRFLCSSTATYIHRMLKFPLDKPVKSWDAQEWRLKLELDRRQSPDEVQCSFTPSAYFQSIVTPDGLNESVFIYFLQMTPSICRCFKKDKDNKGPGELKANTLSMMLLPPEGYQAI